MFVCVKLFYEGMRCPIYIWSNVSDFHKRICIKHKFINNIIFDFVSHCTCLFYSLLILIRVTEETIMIYTFILKSNEQHLIAAMLINYIHQWKMLMKSFILILPTSIRCLSYHMMTLYWIKRFTLLFTLNNNAYYNKKILV